MYCTAHLRAVGTTAPLAIVAVRGPQPIHLCYVDCSIVSVDSTVSILIELVTTSFFFGPL